MRNPTTGKHEIRRFLNATNTEVIGIGDTEAEARADFKVKLDVARKAPFHPTGVTRFSPGYQGFQGENGRVVYRLNPDRKMAISAARPELVDVIHANEAKRKEKEAKKKAKTN